MMREVLWIMCLNWLRSLVSKLGFQLDFMKTVRRILGLVWWCNPCHYRSPEYQYQHQFARLCWKMTKQIGMNEKLYLINVKENVGQNPYKIWVIITCIDWVLRKANENKAHLTDIWKLNPTLVGFLYKFVVIKDVLMQVNYR